MSPHPVRTAPRRAVLTAGLLGAAGLAAACADTAPGAAAPPPGPTSPGAPPPPVATTPPGTYTGDLVAVALGAALANLAAGLYAEAVNGAALARYGQVPGAVTAFLSGAGGQHAAHAAAWNELLTAAGRPAVTGTPVRTADERRAVLRAARAPTDLLALALDLETAVTATVVDRLAEVTDPAVVAVAAGVAPVDAMHAATAAFLLGRSAGAAPSAAGAALGPDALTA